MNWSLKSKVSSQITLNELFLRILSLHNEITNHDIEEKEHAEICTGLNLFANCPILNVLQNKISSYAYHFMVLNLAKSLNWKIIQSPTVFTVYKVEKDQGFAVKKLKSAFLERSCYFTTSMCIPCEHIVACLVHSQDTEANRKYIANLPNFFADR